MESFNPTFEKDKQQIIQWILSLSEPKQLEKLKYLMASNSEMDWRDDISDVEKQAIEETLIQIKNGQGISHQEVKQKYAKWL